MIEESRQDYIENLPKGLSLYLQPDFLSAVNENWTAIVSRNSDKIDWMFPCVKMDKHGLERYEPIELAHDNGLIYLKPGKLSDRPEDLSQAFKLTINDWEKRNVGDLLDRFQVEMRDRQYFDLKSYPIDLADMKKSLRNNIRRRKECRLELIDDIERFYRLFSMVLKRRNEERWSLERVVEIYSRLREVYNSYLFVLVDEEGRDLASNWLIGYENTVYGILAAKNYQINLRGSHEYMKWGIIQKMREFYDIYDIGGSNVPGIKSFNLKMGGINVEYPQYILEKV